MVSVAAFLGALVLAAALSLRGRDFALLAGLEKAGFAWDPAIPIAVLTGTLTGAVAAWLGAQAAMMSPGAWLWFGAAGAAGALWRALKPPRGVTLREPTRSVFAFAFVLTILQAFDAVRFALFALAALSREPLLVACGAFLGMPIGLAQSAQPTPDDDPG